MTLLDSGRANLLVSQVLDSGRVNLLLSQGLDSGRANLLLSQGCSRLSRSFALPELRKTI